MNTGASKIKLRDISPKSQIAATLFGIQNAEYPVILIDKSMTGIVVSKIEIFGETVNIGIVGR